MDKIYGKLPEKEKALLLEDLLGFSICSNGVVYDEDGDEFHGYSINDKYDLDTLNGIIEYIKDKSFEKGVAHIQREIKKTLNL